MRRGLVVWLVLVAAYAATLGVDRGGGGEILTRAEAHRLLTAASIVQDGDVDVADDHRDREWRAFTDRALRPTAEPFLGRVVEPHGIGFPALLAPAYALGGRTGAKLLCAALAALAFALAAALGRRLVGGPWATRAALVAGLSPPALAHGAAVEPFLPGAAVVAGALLLALRVRERPGMAAAAGCAVLVAVAPWLSLHLVAPAAVVALACARWLRRRQRGLVGFVALEVVLVSAVVFVTVHERLVGGPLPTASRAGGGPLPGAGDAGERLLRIPGVLADPEVGLVRWVPAVLLAAVALGHLAVSRRDRLAVAVPGRADVEVAALAVAAPALAAVLVGAVLGPALRGAWLVPAGTLVALPLLAALGAWGGQRAPRTAAVLTVATLGLSVALVAGGFSALGRA